jgi:putative transcription antitermination factor YqgF
MYYLGLDWGKNKVGMAVADKETLIATAYKKVLEENLLEEILDFVQNNKLEKIIVGLNENVRKERKFKKLIDDLKKNKIDLELEDENFSTKMAQKNIKDFKEKNIADIDDEESARIILQSWLDNKKDR